MGYVCNVEPDGDGLVFEDLSFLKIFIEEHKDDQLPIEFKSDGAWITIRTFEHKVDVQVSRSGQSYASHRTYWITGEIDEWSES